MNRYIFDLDGTLVSSGQTITEAHASHIKTFSKYNYCYLVTSGEYKDVKKQLGEDLISCFDFVFSSSGNAVYKDNELYKYDDWLLTDLMREWLLKAAMRIPYHKIKVEIVDNPGSVLLFLLGKTASKQDKIEFSNWILNETTRKDLCYAFNTRFPMYTACISGSTSIQITKKNKDKQQITDYFSDSDKLIFFGNKIHPYGNDYSLAAKILSKKLGHIYSVKNPQDTYDILTSIAHNT